MSEGAPRGGGDDGAMPARQTATAAKLVRTRAGATTAQTRSRRRLPAIGVDRIIAMRIALVVLVLVFLYLVVWIGARAFGSGAKQVTRIDRVIIDATAPQPPAPAPATDAARTHRAPP